MDTLARRDDRLSELGDATTPPPSSTGLEGGDDEGFSFDGSSNADSWKNTDAARDFFRVDGGGIVGDAGVSSSLVAVCPPPFFSADATTGLDPSVEVGMPGPNLIDLRLDVLDDGE